MAKIDVFCPHCLSAYGKKKLLFQKDEDAKGTVEIACRGCRQIIKIKLDAEPMSRSDK